jgi:hypothetical protein
MNGTGAAPSLVKGRAAGQRREPGTVVVPPPEAAPSSSRGALYGVIAFLVIAAGGGAGGYYFFFQKQLSAAPVTVERASVAEMEPPRQPAPAVATAAEPPAKPVEPAPAPPAPAAAPAEPVAKPPEPVANPSDPVKEAPPEPPKLAAAEPPKPAEPVRPRQRRAPAPVVVVHDAPAPEAPRPVVTAKGELVLLIRPWAKVEVDGRDVGITPLNEPLMLAAGDHTVRLTNPELQKEVTRTVHITASEREVLKEILDE